VEHDVTGRVVHNENKKRASFPRKAVSVLTVNDEIFRWVAAKLVSDADERHDISRYSVLSPPKKPPVRLGRTVEELSWVCYLNLGDKTFSHFRLSHGA